MVSIVQKPAFQVHFSSWIIWPNHQSNQSTIATFQVVKSFSHFYLTLFSRLKHFHCIFFNIYLLLWSKYKVETLLSHVGETFCMFCWFALYYTFTSSEAKTTTKPSSGQLRAEPEFQSWVKLEGVEGHYTPLHGTVVSFLNPYRISEYLDRNLERNFWIVICENWTTLDIKFWL